MEILGPSKDEKLLEFCRQDYLSLRGSLLVGIAQNSEQLIKLCIQVNVLGLTGLAVLYGYMHGNVSVCAIGVCATIHLMAILVGGVVLWNGIRIGTKVIEFLAKYHPGSPWITTVPVDDIPKANNYLEDLGKTQKWLVLVAILLVVLAVACSFFVSIAQLPMKSANLASKETGIIIKSPTQEMGAWQHGRTYRQTPSKGDIHIV